MRQIWEHVTECLLTLLLGFTLVAAASERAAAQKQGELVPTIHITSTTAGFSTLQHEGARMVAKEWRNLGFDVEVKDMDWKKIVELGMKEHTLGVTFLGWGGRPERLDPYYWLHTMYHSSNAKKGGRNIPHYMNPEYDAIADQFATTGDVDKRRELAFKLQEIAARDVPLIPFYRRSPHYGYNGNELENVKVMPGMGFNNFWNAIYAKPIGGDRTLRYGWPKDFLSLNPLSTLQGNDHGALRLMYDSLFRLSLEGTTTPWVATDLKRINDTTYDVTLRKDMKWHDGQPFTAEDVKFTYDLIKLSNAPYSGWRVRQLDRVEILDTNTVRFVLTEPFAPFVNYTLSEVFLLPKHIWEPKLKELGEKEILNWDALPVIGSGPFKFDYWRRGVEAKLNANRDHFQAPEIDAFIYVPYGSAATLVEGLAAGEINISGFALEPIQIERVKNSDRLKVATAPELGLRTIHLNLQIEPMDRVEIRRAMASAVPKDEFVKLVMEGYGAAAYNVVAPENSFWHNPDTEKLGNNPTQAREILAKAGYTWDSQGRLHYPAQ